MKTLFNENILKVKQTMFFFQDKTTAMKLKIIQEVLEAVFKFRKHY